MYRHGRRFFYAHEMGLEMRLHALTKWISILVSWLQIAWSGFAEHVLPRVFFNWYLSCWLTHTTFIETESRQWSRFFEKTFDLGVCFAPQRRTLFRHRIVIESSESAPNAAVFNTFHFQMRLVPQRRALFRHRNFQKRAGRDTVLTIFTSKCASRRNGVQFFIFHLASWLRARRFGEPTFRPSGATKQRKNTVFRNFPTFSRTCIFTLLTFSLCDLLHLLSSFFWLSPCLSLSFVLAVLLHLSILSEVCLVKKKVNFLGRKQQLSIQILHPCSWFRSVSVLPLA